MFFVFSGVIWMMVSVFVVCMEVPARLSLENKHGKLWCQAYLQFSILDLLKKKEEEEEEEETRNNRFYPRNNRNNLLFIDFVLHYVFR